MIVAYVAGPFRGVSAWDIEQNIRRAEEIALELWQMGVAVMCPHTNTRFFEGAAPDSVWLDGYLEILKRCDVVVMVNGWEKSTGSRAERLRALELDIPVFDSIEFIRSAGGIEAIESRVK